jgi:hypothetical protein
LLEKHWKTIASPDSVVGKISIALTLANPIAEISDNKSETILQEQIAAIAGVDTKSVRLFAQLGQTGPTSIISPVDWKNRAFFAVVVVTYAIDTNSTAEAQEISERLLKVDRERVSQLLVPRFRNNGVNCQKMTISGVVADVGSTKFATPGQSHFLPFAPKRRLLFIYISGVALFTVSFIAWNVQKTRAA